MPIIVHCSACSREVRVPDALLGLNVRCPICRHVFTAASANGAATVPPQDSPSPPPPDPPTRTEPAPVPPAEAPPAPADDPDSVACPSCGTRNPKQLASCHNCQYNLRDADDGDSRGRRRRPREDDDDRPWERGDVRRDWEPHRGTLVLVLGIISVVMITNFAFVALPLGLAAWILGSRDLKKMRDGMMDPAGQSNTKAGYVCGIIGTCLGGVCSLFAGAYIIFIIALVGATSGARPGGPAPVMTKPAAPPPGKFSLTEGLPSRPGDYLPSVPRWSPAAR